MNGSDGFTPVYFHRLKYFLSPQLDLYRNIGEHIERSEMSGSKLEILDYGCGSGFGLLALFRPWTRLVGIDSDRSVIQFAIEVLGNIASFQASDWSCADMGGPYGRYDVITCVEVIEHVEGQLDLLRAFKRVAAPGAKFFISTLNHNSQYRKNDSHVGKFWPKDFREMLEGEFDFVKLVDYKLRDEIHDSSTITPMVAICSQKT